MKKIFVVFFAILCSLWVFACKEPENTYDFDAVFNKIFKDVEKDNLKTDLYLPNKAGTVTFKWTSSNPSVIAISNDKGVVTRQDQDVVVKITAEMKYEKQEATKSIDLKVAKNDFKTTADFQDGVKGDEFEITGVVTAYNAQSFILTDNVGSILVYRGASWVRDVNIGDKVTVAGVVEVYGAANQFGTTSTYSVNGSETVTYPTPKELTISECDAYANNKNIKGTYVKIKGQLTVSGNYVNITIIGATVAGSVTYPVDMNEMNALNNKNVIVTGYLTGFTGGKYLSIVATKVEEDTSIVPDVAVKANIGEINAGEVGKLYEVTGVVVATNAQGFIIKDSTGMMLVYCGSSYQKDLVIGDKVAVKGRHEKYAGAVQLGTNPTYTKVGTEEVNHGEAYTVTTTDLNNYLTATEVAIKYVSITGKLVIDGNYFNLEFEGSTIVGSITYPAVTTIFTPYANKEVTITGYITGSRYSSSSSIHLLNIMYLEVEGDGEPIEAKSISEILESEVSSSYSTSGTVVAINGDTFMIKDGTGVLSIYRGNGWTSDVEIGDLLSVTGTLTKYNNGYQFGLEASYAKIGTAAVNHGEPTEITAEVATSYGTNTNIISSYVKMTGVLSVSGTTTKYFNVAIDGSDVVGSIARPLNSSEVELLAGSTVVVYGYVTNVSGSTTKYLNVLPVGVYEEGKEPTPSDVETIANVKKGTTGEVYTIRGTVVGINAQSFLLKDNTSYLLIYKGNSFAKDVAIGDTVKATGILSSYGGAMQFGTDATYEKESSGLFTQPTPTVLTAAAADSYSTNTAIEATYVKVTGELVQSGNYFNLNIPGATIVGSITYPVDPTSLGTLNGKTVICEGYITGTASSGKYLNFLAVKIYEEGKEPDPDPTGEVIEGTVQDALTAVAGSTYKVSAAVVAVNAQSFIIKDSTGMILVYMGTEWANDVLVGDKVTVTGPTAKYGLALQFNLGTTYTKDGTETVSNPEPIELSVLETDAYKTKTEVSIQFVTIMGKLVTSGTYYNIAIKDGAVAGSIAYPTDEVIEELTEYLGKNIYVTGYVTSFTNSTYLNILLVQFEEGPEEEDTTYSADAIKYDFVTYLDAIVADWGSNAGTYGPKTISSAILGNPSVSAIFDFNKANKQTNQAISDRPVIATGKGVPTAYLTMEANFTGYTKVSFELLQWGSKIFDEIYIEYTTDGTTWTICSEKIKTPGVIMSNVDISSATKVRLVAVHPASVSADSNHQLGLSRVVLDK